MIRRAGPYFYSILCAAAAFTSCIRLAPQTMPDLPAAFIDRAVLCAGVVRSGDWAEPEDEKSVFSPGADSGVCAVLIFGPVSGGHRLAWKWYGPDGRLARESDPTKVGRDGAAYDRYIAWDRLALSEETAAGRWTVVFFMDGETADSREFEVKREPPGETGFSPGSGF